MSDNVRIVAVLQASTSGMCLAIDKVHGSPSDTEFTIMFDIFASVWVHQGHGGYEITAKDRHGQPISFTVEDAYFRNPCSNDVIRIKWKSRRVGYTGFKTEYNHNLQAYTPKIIN